MALLVDQAQPGKRLAVPVVTDRSEIGVSREPLADAPGAGGSVVCATWERSPDVPCSQSPVWGCGCGIYAYDSCNAEVTAVRPRVSAVLLASSIPDSGQTHRGS